MDKEKQAFERPYWDHDKHSDALAYERAAEMYMDELENEIAHLKDEIERKDEALQYIVDVINNRQKDSWLNRDLPEYLADYICNRAEQALHIKEK